MFRARSFAIGALTFLAAHAVVVVFWRSFLPEGDFPPWFLNAGWAVAFTAASLAAAAAIAVSSERSLRNAVLEGANVAAGAFAAMTIVLFASGPGTIVPIALGFAAAIAAASCAAGVGLALAVFIRLS